MLLTVTFRIPAKIAQEFEGSANSETTHARLTARIREVVAAAGLTLPLPTENRDREARHDGDQG